MSGVGRGLQNLTFVRDFETGDQHGGLWDTEVHGGKESATDHHG